MFAQLKMLPMERASLPMPSKTAPTPFMTPCAVPQALSVRAHAIAKKLRLIITAPFFRSDLRNFEQFAKNFWTAAKNRYASACSGVHTLRFWGAR
jgi:hypothetical protein